MFILGFCCCEFCTVHAQLVADPHAKTGIVQPSFEHEHKFTLQNPVEFWPAFKKNDAPEDGFSIQFFVVVFIGSCLVTSG